MEFWTEQTWTYLSKDDKKLFAGIGLKLRIDVGGSVVDVKIGLLVERVWVLVVGWVLVVTRACVVSGKDVTFSVGVDVLVAPFAPFALVDEFWLLFGFCNEFSTGIEILAFIMCTSAFGWPADEIIDCMKLR